MKFSTIIKIYLGIISLVLLFGIYITSTKEEPYVPLVHSAQEAVSLFPKTKVDIDKLVIDSYKAKKALKQNLFNKSERTQIHQYSCSI